MSMHLLNKRLSINTLNAILVQVPLNYNIPKYSSSFWNHIWYSHAFPRKKFNTNASRFNMKLQTNRFLHRICLTICMAIYEAIFYAIVTECPFMIAHNDDLKSRWTLSRKLFTFASNVPKLTLLVARECCWEAETEFSLIVKGINWRILS